MAFMAERSAARSTTEGTPVKSCKITRAALYGISESGLPAGFQLAMVSTASLVISKPSAWRSAASSITFIENGNLLTGATPAFSSASSR